MTQENFRYTCLLIDFFDSFTLNIASYLSEAGFKVSLASYEEFESDRKSLDNFDLICLGPGPGLPLDYSSLFPLVEELIKTNKTLLGVCLGHQILWHLHGGKLRKLDKPQHGQNYPLNVDKSFAPLGLTEGRYQVQSYNSWATILPGPSNGKKILHDDQILVWKTENITSFQFHPESVGTSCPQAFFDPGFLMGYNRIDATHFSENFRHL